MKKNWRRDCVTVQELIDRLVRACDGDTKQPVIITGGLYNNKSLNWAGVYDVTDVDILALPYNGLYADKGLTVGIQIIIG